MSGIFICYRRQDTDYIAGRLHNQLAAHFGPDLVFRDINTIAPGSDFGKRIGSFVGSCDALVAVIGDDWLNKDEKGRRRIDRPKDWVRQEIASALERDILVVPVLVENATMPAAADLPAAIRGLASRNAMDLSDARWDYEVQTLIKALEEVVEPPAGPARSASPPPAPAPPRDQPPARPAPAAAAPQPAPSPPAWTPRAQAGPSSPAPAPHQWRPAAAGPQAGPQAPSGGTGFPSWAKVAVPVVLVVVAVAVVLAVALSGDDGEQVVSTSVPDAVTTGPATGPATSATATPATPAGARTITGPWTGTNGRLTMAVEKVEVEGSRIRLHLLVTNRSSDTLTLPTFGYFSAIDNAGHDYEVGPTSWPRQFPPGEVRGTIDLAEGPQRGASTLKVGFGTIFGSLAVRGGIYVDGVKLA